jgi:hypothetical protein
MFTVFLIEITDPKKLQPDLMLFNIYLNLYQRLDFLIFTSVFCKETENQIYIF